MGTATNQPACTFLFDDDTPVPFTTVLRPIGTDRRHRQPGLRCTANRRWGRINGKAQRTDYSPTPNAVTYAALAWCLQSQFTHKSLECSELRAWTVPDQQLCVSFLLRTHNRDGWSIGHDPLSFSQSVTLRCAPVLDSDAASTVHTVVNRAANAYVKSGGQRDSRVLGRDFPAGEVMPYRLDESPTRFRFHFHVHDLASV